LQPSAVVALQAPQAAPFVPHTPSVVAGETHVVPEQQPPGHDVALQTQAPAEQI